MFVCCCCCWCCWCCWCCCCCYCCWWTKQKSIKCHLKFLQAYCKMEDVEKKWMIWRREIKKIRMDQLVQPLTLFRFRVSQKNSWIMEQSLTTQFVPSYWISFFSFPFQQRSRVGVSLGKCHVVPRTKQTEGQVTYMNYFFLRLLLGSKKSQTLRKQMGLLL